MIWIRRILAVPLILLFVPLFVAVLLLFHINDTLLSADFYIQEIRRTEVFPFLYDDLLPAAVQMIEEQTEDFPLEPGVASERLDRALRVALPPEWLQEQTEGLIAAVVPYAVGDEDHFAVRIALRSRVEALGTVIKDDLASEDTYTLLLEDVAVPELEKLLSANPLPYGIVLGATDIADAVREVFPPQWVHDRVSHVVDQTVPFVTGDAAHFAITMPIADRVQVLVPALKELLERSQAYHVLSHPELSEDLDRWLGGNNILPGNVEITSAQVIPVLEAVAPPSWIQARVEGVLDEVVPYLIGQQEHFALVIPLRESITAAGPAVKTMLRDIDAYDTLFAEALTTLVEGKLSEIPALPSGVTLTAEEIVSTVQSFLPPEFIQEQVEGIIDALVPYVTGDAEGFSVTIPFGERKEAALEAIDALVSEKLEQMLATLPACTLEEALELARGGVSGLALPCKPTGYTLDEIKEALGITASSVTEDQVEELAGFDLSLVMEGLSLEDLKAQLGLTDQVSQYLERMLPNNLAFSDATLRSMLGPERGELLDNALEWGRDGFTITDSDLQDRLSDDQEQTLAQVREWGRNGFTYTDTDLREDLVGSSGNTANVETMDRVLQTVREGFTFTDEDLREAIASSGGAQAMETLDTVRMAVGTARSLAFLGYVVLLLFLLLIGVLGGRRWGSRLAWAAVALAIPATALYVVFGPAFPVLYREADPFIGDALQGIAESNATLGPLLAAKAMEVISMVVHDFVSALATRALAFLIGAFVALVIAILWLARRRPAPPASPTDTT